jgi:hypothetical protein
VKFFVQKEEERYFCGVARLNAARVAQPESFICLLKQFTML